MFLCTTLNLVCLLWQQNMHQAEADIDICLRRYMPYLQQNGSLGGRDYVWVDAANHCPGP